MCKSWNYFQSVGKKVKTKEFLGFISVSNVCVAHVGLNVPLSRTHIWNRKLFRILWFTSWIKMGTLLPDRAEWPTLRTFLARDPSPRLFSHVHPFFKDKKSKTTAPSGHSHVPTINLPGRQFRYLLSALSFSPLIREMHRMSKRLVFSPFHPPCSAPDNAMAITRWARLVWHPGILISRTFFLALEQGRRHGRRRRCSRIYAVEMFSELFWVIIFDL